MGKFSSALVMAEQKKDFWKGIELKNNERLVDNSGFVPLDVRFKKLDIATAQRKLALASFDYHDYDELFDDDINFSQYDSLEELQDKLEKYTNRKKEILATKFAKYRAQRTNEANLNAKNPVENVQTSNTKQTNSNNDTAQ